MSLCQPRTSLITHSLVFRPNSKSQRNIPAAAGSAESPEGATSSSSSSSSSSHNGNVVVNGGQEAAMNGVAESDVEEDMEIN